MIYSDGQCKSIKARILFSLMFLHDEKIITKSDLDSLSNILTGKWVLINNKMDYEIDEGECPYS